MLHAVGIDVLQPDMQCYSLAWASYVPSAQLMGSDAVCASVVRRAARAIKQWSCMHACTQCVRSHALGVVHRVMRWGWADHMQRIIYLCRSTVWYKEEEGERERKNPKKKMGWWKVGTEEDGRKRHLEDCLQVARYSLFSKTLFSHCKNYEKVCICIYKYIVDIRSLINMYLSYLVYTKGQICTSKWTFFLLFLGHNLSFV